MKKPQHQPPAAPAVVDIEPAGDFPRLPRRTVLVVAGKADHVMAELKRYALGESAA